MSVEFLYKVIGSLLAHSIVVENQEGVHFLVVEIPDPGSALVAPSILILESFCVRFRDVNSNFTFVFVWMSNSMVVVVMGIMMVVAVSRVLLLYCILVFNATKRVRVIKLTVIRMSVRLFLLQQLH